MSAGPHDALLSIEPYVSLGLEALEIGEECTRIAVPLAGNRNDKGTMFAGSIGAAMMLAGWRMCVAWAEATRPHRRTRALRRVAGTGLPPGCIAVNCPTTGVSPGSPAGPGGS